jgi:hypothetical protein
VPVVGWLQAKRERRRGLQVPGEVNGRGSDVVGELGSVCVCCVVCYLLSCPLRRGSSPSFHRPRRRRITSMPHYSATWGGMVCNAVE